MLFARGSDPKLALLIEIQSSLVRGSLALFGAKGAAPSILATQSLDIDYKPGAPSAYYVKTTLEGVATIVDAVLQSASSLPGRESVRPSAAHFVLSSPWVVSQAKTVTIAFDKDTPITPDRVRSILDAERTNAGASLGKDILAIAIEEKVFDIKLNGYSLHSWKGKLARELEIAYALSVGSADSIEKLRQAVASAVGPRAVSFHSSLLLQYASLRSLRSAGESYMLVHVHGELTDLLVVRQGACSFFGSYPIGVNTAIRELGKATRTSRRTAESLLSLYLGRHMEDSEEARVGVAVQAMAKDWADKLSKLALSAGHEAAPAEILLLAHAHEDLFLESLRAAYPQSRASALSVDRMGTYASAIAELL